MKLALPLRRRQRTLDDALLPLVNIVFLLMIFFLFAGHWGSGTHNAPRSQVRSTVRAADAVLELKADQRMQLAGETFPDDGLQARAHRYENRPLDIRTEGAASASRVLRAMSVLQQAGVKDLRLLAIRDRGHS